MLAAIYTFIVAWLATGLVLAAPFAFLGAGKALRKPAALSIGARLLIIPGAAILWPWTLWRWVRALGQRRRR